MSTEDRSPDNSDADRFGGLTDRLGAAFDEQAARFEPSHDAYAKVAQAVAEAERPAPSSRWLRPLATAAVVVASVGVGGLVLSLQGSQSLDTGPGGQEVTASTIVESSTTAPAQVQDDAGSDGGQVDGESAQSGADQPETEADDERDSGAPLAGPVRSTELEAAQAFLDQLRLPFGAPELVDGQVVVRSFEPGGEAGGDGLIAATLSMVEADGGFAVVEARSDSVTIDAVAHEGPGSPLSVSGTGTGFEATLDVDLVSAVDNRILASTFTNAGNFGEAQPYAFELPVVGSEHAWIVVSSSGGADGVINPFAAKLVSYASSVDDPTTYTVVGVAPDDVDEGLVVRSGPGTSSDRVGVLASGSAGISRGNAYPVPVGDDVWWSVVGPDGLSGWVNSRFLASDEAVTDAELDALASSLRFLVGDGSSASLLDLPLTRRMPVLVGAIDRPLGLAAEDLTRPQTWGEVRDFPLPEVYGEPRTASLAELLHTENWSTAELQPGGSYSYPSDAAVARTYFGELSSIVIAPDNPSSPWDRTFVFVEKAPAGALEVIGLVLEVQQP